jgi:hypothetical protein
MGEENRGQSLTLSLRISEALRSRLEGIRELVSRRKEESVTMSEVAKQLLEAAGDEHMEEVNLYQSPTESLLSIRRKVAEKRPLSKAEWAFVAQYVQRGMESAEKNPISPESFAGVLEAFRALYPERKTHVMHNGYYLGNLSLDSYERQGTDDAAVLAGVEATIRRVRESARPYTPVQCARNLYVLLDREQFASVETINATLAPYWPVLWRVAARGHFVYEKKPIRDTARPQELPGQPSFPPFVEGPYRLSVTVGEHSEMHLLLSFPGPMGPMYPLGPYPKIAEFRAMLSRLKAERKEINGYSFDAGFWNGERFFGYAVTESEAAGYWFRAYENGITFGFTNEGWEQVRELFRKAWSNPELNAIWQKLGQEYGEL